jgi:hypothetical protein
VSENIAQKDRKITLFLVTILVSVSSPTLLQHNMVYPTSRYLAASMSCHHTWITFSSHISIVISPNGIPYLSPMKTMQKMHKEVNEGKEVNEYNNSNFFFASQLY